MKYKLKENGNYIEIGGYILFVTILLSLVGYARSSGNLLFYVYAYLLFIMFLVFPQDETD